MTIQYIPPLRRAWQRMVEQLFRPFDIGKWFILGFTCWLVRLVEGGGGGGGGQVSVPPIDDGAFERFDPMSWWDRLSQNLGIGLLIAGIGCVILVILAVVLLVFWIGSRAHFLFLDNVVLNRAQVVAPWKEYRREGNSLFVWRLAFTLVSILTVLLLAVPGVWILWATADGGSGAAIAGGLITLLVPVLLVAVAVAFIDLFLTDFVVPVMYKKRLKTTEAWRVFLPRLRENLPELVIYGFLVLALHIVVGMGIFVVGLWTCCIAFVVLMLPIVGTMVLLPLHVTYRLYSVEFLAQLGSDFDLLPPAPTGGGTPPAEPAPTVSAG